VASFNLGQGSASSVLLQRSDLAVPGILVGFPAAYGLGEAEAVLGHLIGELTVYSALCAEGRLEPALGAEVITSARLNTSASLAPAVNSKIEVHARASAKITLRGP
jgi:hypothetical protein